MKTIHALLNCAIFLFFQGKLPPDMYELGSSKMERMLQSLNVENRAGYIFTHFCEKSGNKV